MTPRCDPADPSTYAPGESRNCGYRIVVSQPGYLPEMEPYVCEDLESAKEALLEEVVRTFDSLDCRDLDRRHQLEQDSADAEVWIEEEMDETGGDCYLGGYVHSAYPVGPEMGC